MSVLVKPIVTEKATKISESLGCYTFSVMLKANKIEIKDAVEKRYDVSVQSVRTMIYPVKRRKKNTKKGMVVSRKSAYKKAIVKLKEGGRIDFYDNVK